jgi:hypothetical protein
MMDDILLNKILDKVDEVGKRRDMSWKDIQALKESLRNLINKTSIK